MPTPALLLALAVTAADPPALTRPFAVTVVDEQTGRGVPLIELKTVNDVRYVTDSAGVAAVVEPGLVGQNVFFHVKGHGYEFPKDGFGFHGKALAVTAGGAATLKVRRLNVAERLYRVTGAGVYRDTVLAGRTPPTRRPVLNAQVLGSDSVLNAVYRGKLHWFWGDTNRPGYPLGNFHVPGATSDLPGSGGLDPDVGVDLDYFTAPNGFAAETAHLPGDGPTWLGGLVVVKDREGRDRLVAGYAKIKPPMDTYDQGLVVFDPDTHTFTKAATFPLDAPVRPSGHTYVARDGGTEYVYYTTPFAVTRVRAEFEAMKELSNYEAFTCLERGTRLDPKGKTPPKVERDAAGRPRYGWKPQTSALGPADEARLVREGHLKAEDAVVSLRDVETGKAVLAHGGTVTWNAFRERWVLIAVELFGGPSLLGEVWYAEADTPLGPWAYARKVVTHDKYSFYNPRQHPYFDKDGGRVIYFEGTYTASFSGNTDPTPRYEYNQVMYRLDLSDPRLNLPVAVYESEGGGYATGAAHAGRGPARFFALERPAANAVAVGGKPGAEGQAFYALRAADPSKGVVALAAADGRYVTGGTPKSPAGLVWPAVSTVALPAGR